MHSLINNAYVLHASNMATTCICKEKKLAIGVLAIAVLTATIGMSMMMGQNVKASCTGDPHDRDAPTGNPHDDGEHGNPHDSGGGHHGQEGDNCHGAQ
jgi:hypothetical protein